MTRGGHYGVKCETGSGGGRQHWGDIVRRGVIVQQVMSGEKTARGPLAEADRAGVATVVDVAPAPGLGLRPPEDQDQQQAERHLHKEDNKGREIMVIVSNLHDYCKQLSRSRYDF